MKKRIKLNLEQERDVIKMKKDKISNLIICNKYNISESCIYTILKRNGREHLIANKKYQINENYFEKIDTEEKAYWLGFLYADGNVRIHKGRSGILKLKLKQSDRQHIEKFNECLNSNYPIKDGIDMVIVKGKEYKCPFSVVCIYNTKIVKDLIYVGCVENKTQKIRLPFLNDELIRHFIRGYFDGDGCISKQKLYYNCYTITITSCINFILDIKKQLDNIFNSDFGIIESENKMYSNLFISDRENREKFYHYIYDNSNICLERKKEIFEDMIIIKDTGRKGKTNIKKYKLVDPNGNIFITNKGLKDFCLSHNLNCNNINNVLYKLVKHYKGWYCEKII